MSLDQYVSIEDLRAKMLEALRAGDHERALEVFTDLTRLAVLAEREACANVADLGPWVTNAGEIAAAIRARRAE